MSELFSNTIFRLLPVVRSGDLDACERVVVQQIRDLPRSPFHISIDVTISNDPADAARHFDRFFKKEAHRFKIAAAYTEMNGFDINPNRWYCDLFGYASYGGHDDYEWLCDYQSELFEDCTIRGLEELQAVYARDLLEENSFRDASYMSSLLVVIKFQQFMKRAAAKMAELSFPLLVTAHDFDFIAEVGPKA